jgi:hypothetical protein
LTDLSYPPGVFRPTAALIVALALAGGACDGGQSATERAAKTRSDQARQVARRAGLPAAVQDFLARYAASAAKSFTVNYAPDPDGTTIVLTQAPPDRRLDLVRGGVTESFFATQQGSFDCVLRGRAWTCTSTSTEAGQLAPLAPADVDRTVAALQASKASFTFRVVDRRVAGTRTSCLETVPKTGAGGAASTGPTSLCISPEGAPLLVQGQATQLRATRYTTEVDQRRLRLPAPPTPATTAG